MTQHPLVRHIPLPHEPTDAMLLDLALVYYWDDTPGESREDFAQAYLRMQAHLPKRPVGYFLAPVAPDERLLLAIAGVDKFVVDSDELECTEFAAAYEGYETMLRNLQLRQSGKREACPRVELGDMTGVAPEALMADGITDYCEQVCGTRCCGSGPVCQFGIDHSTNMPATAEVLAMA